MRPEKCLACQGQDFYHTTMDAEGGVLLRGKFLSSVIVKCSVCLSCGFVAPYLSPGDLDTVRGWKAKAKKAKATVDKR